MESIQLILVIIITINMVIIVTSILSILLLWETNKIIYMDN